MKKIKQSITRMIKFIVNLLIYLICYVILSLSPLLLWIRIPFLDDLMKFFLGLFSLDIQGQVEMYVVAVLSIIAGGAIKRRIEKFFKRLKKPKQNSEEVLKNEFHRGGKYMKDLVEKIRVNLRTLLGRIVLLITMLITFFQDRLGMDILRKLPDVKLGSLTVSTALIPMILIWFYCDIIMRKPGMETCEQAKIREQSEGILKEINSFKKSSIRLIEEVTELKDNINKNGIDLEILGKQSVDVRTHVMSLMDILKELEGIDYKEITLKNLDKIKAIFNKAEKQLESTNAFLKH